MRRAGGVTGFGFMMALSPREAIGRFADLSREAERLGFETAWLADSQLYTKERLRRARARAERTATVRLGPGVTNPVTRHVTVTANALAALDEVSAGRAQLGSAPATPLSSRSAGARPGSPSCAMRSSRCARSRAARASTSAGAAWRSRRAGPPYPVLLAASQPRMLALAGPVADGAVVSDAFVDSVGVAGYLEHCVARIRPLVDLGVDRITGRELIPALRAG